MKNFIKDNLKFNTIEVSILMIISILLGLVIGFILTYGKGLAKEVDTDSNINDFYEIYDEVLEYSYDKKDSKNLVDSSIQGLINELNDPYAVYMDKIDTKKYDENIKGKFMGLGITINMKDGKCIISNVIKNGPAYKSGLLKNDIIISINDNDVSNLNTEDISNLIKNSKNKVKVTIERNKEKTNYNIKKDYINIVSVYSKIIERNDNKIGYIYITNFYNNTYKQFINKLDELENKNIDSLIIDVRDNLGGPLRQVDLILSEFFPKDKILYYETTNDYTKEIYSLNNKRRDYEVVVLSNKFTASSAEVLVSSFKDNYKFSTIVGEKTYGKASIQNIKKLKSGASFKYTYKKWLTPKGKVVDSIGIEPDVYIDSVYDGFVKTSDDDYQFKKALEILEK